ncbi:MAG: GAF domain-containing protein, partial [Anaerolineales bacterium]|nr:GAF domain-containing protein [Anaerolineales bacterium]
AIAIMLNPWRFAHGVIFDTRSVLLSLSGLYFGLLPTLVATTMASIFRGYLGGAGAFTGVGSILIASSIGLLWRFSLQRNKKTPQWYELYAFGWVVHLALLVWFLTLPPGLAFPAIRAIALPFLAIHPLATVLIGLLFNRYETRQQIEQALIENEALFSTTFHTNPHVMAITRLRDGVILDINHSFSQLLGLSPQEVKGRHLVETQFRIEPEELEGITQKIQEQGHIENFPLHLRLPSGEVRQFLYSAATVNIQNEPCLINVGTDITELQEKQQALERRLRELQVINAVGLATVSINDEDDLIARVTAILAAELYHERCGVMLIDHTTEEVYYHPSYHINQPITTSSLPLSKGLIGDVIQKGIPVIVSDMHKDSRYIDSASSTRSALVVPLRVSGEVLGVIDVESSRVNAFTQDDHRLLCTVADQLSGAIERLRAQKHAAEQSRVAESLAATAITLNTSLDLETIFEKLVKNVRIVIPCDAANITLLEGDETYIVYMDGYETHGDVEWTRNSRLMLSATPNYQEMLRSKKPLIIPDTHSSSLWRVFNQADWIASYLAAPICVDGEVIGFLNLDHSSPNFFTTDHAKVLGTFAEHAAIAIRNARMFNEIRRRLNELEAISHVSLALRAAHSPEELLPLLLEETLRVLETSSGAIWLMDSNSRNYRCVLARGWMAESSISKIMVDQDFADLVSTQGKMLVMPDLETENSVKSHPFSSIPKGWKVVCLPIASTTDILGVLCVSLTPNHQFSQQDRNILTTLAEIAAIALQRSKLLVDLQHQADRLTSLRQIDRAISANTDFYVMAETILQETQRHLDLDAIQIWTFESHLSRLVFTAGVGLKRLPPTKASYTVGEGLAGKIAFSIQPLAINDLRKWIAQNNYNDCQEYLEEGFIAYLGMPLMIKGKLGGVIELCHRSQLSSLAANDPQWLSFAQTIASQTALAMENAELFRNLNNTLMELSISYDETLKGWAKALELRDRETGGHSERVTEWTLRIALALGIDKDHLIHIRRGAILHDIGKIGVPDTILLKKGPLTPQEWQIIHQHPLYAFELLHNIHFLEPALDIPYCHHEKWDGSGYPRGLRGEEIPLAARIFAVVDVWDALTSDRPYRKAWSQTEAREYIRSQAGKHFDPRIVEVFLKLLDETDLKI